MRESRISEDAKTLLMLCTAMALPAGRRDEFKPLTAREWNELAKVLYSVGVKGPAELLGYGVEQLRQRIGLSEGQAARLVALLERGGQLAIELEDLLNQGYWITCRADADYPAKLRKRLAPDALPPVLFGVGDQGLLADGFLAVVGSRDVDQSGARYAEQLGELCACGGNTIVSGFARGVDKISMLSCLRAGGRAVGVLADSMTRAIRDRETRSWVMDGRLALISAEIPQATFKVWQAMNRNKLIYCLAKYGVVVSASADKGGTWAGALEALAAKWLPLFVRDGSDVPEGNRKLLKKGALPLGKLDEATDLKSVFQGLQQTTDFETPQAEMLPLVALTDSLEQQEPYGTELLPIVWPHIAKELRHAPGMRSLAEHLNVRVEQLRDWLEQAVDRGMVKYDQKADVYSLVREEPEDYS